MTHCAEVYYDYVEDVDANLTCAICQSALVEPVTSTSCKHTFCRDCIKKAISINPQCPIDRSALTYSSLKDTEQLVQVMLDELKVRCCEEGCGEEMERGLLLNHLRTCSKTIVTCPDGDCGITMSRSKLSHHRAYACFRRKMECHKCKVMLTLVGRNGHNAIGCDEPKPVCTLCGLPQIDGSLHRWVCHKVRVPCSHSERGCNVITTRSQLSAHLPQCPFEALSTFFSNNDARFEALEDRVKRASDWNKALSSRVKKLEERNKALVRHVKVLTDRLVEVCGDTMTRDIQAYLRGDDIASRGIAGHRFESPSRVEDLNTIPPVDRTEPEFLFDARPRPVSASSTTNPTAHLGVLGHLDDAILATLYDDEDESEEEGEDDDDASEAGNGGAPAAAPVNTTPTTRQPPSFGLVPHQSFADHVFTRLSRGVDQTSLRALRGIVMHLAGGMDDMERRNEIRTMTESLRVMDEVGSLRAIVNTLRTQVMMVRAPNGGERTMPTPTPANSTGEEAASTSGATSRTPADPPQSTTSASSSTMPFSAYATPEMIAAHYTVSPEIHAVALPDHEDGEDDGSDDDSRRYSIRESISSHRVSSNLANQRSQSSQPTHQPRPSLSAPGGHLTSTSMSSRRSSTTSLVTVGGAPRSRATAWAGSGGGRVGRPMGLPTTVFPDLTGNAVNPAYSPTNGRVTSHIDMAGGIRVGTVTSANTTSSSSHSRSFGSISRTAGSRLSGLSLARNPMSLLQRRAARDAPAREPAT